VESLKEGDIVIVSTVIGGLREYPVKEIIGNKAITDFRIFNKKIYPGGSIYEYGKHPYSTTNGYWIKKPQTKES
jgi:hypothetical protein